MFSTIYWLLEPVVSPPNSKLMYTVVFALSITALTTSQVAIFYLQGLNLRPPSSESTMEPLGPRQLVHLLFLLSSWFFTPFLLVLPPNMEHLLSRSAPYCSSTQKEADFFLSL